MTMAVCVRCGSLKFGAWKPCGHDPEILEDRAKHLMLTDHYYTQQELEQMSVRFKSGAAWFFDEVAIRAVIESLKEVEQEVLGGQRSI